MTDKRYLFRGFHPDESGKTTITLNGEKIRGEWLYWNQFGQLVDPHSLQTKRFYYKCDGIDLSLSSAAMLIWADETIGQWVTTDKNGKDVFLGDRVWANGGFSYSDTFSGIVGYNPLRMSFALLESDETYFHDLHKYQIEVYGNKWEMTE